MSNVYVFLKVQNIVRVLLPTVHTYKIKKLPNMVSLITKWTPPLNSHRKTGPGHISYVPY